MLENTTVTMTLKDFDTLRDAEKSFTHLRKRVASCFEYLFEENPDAKTCENCDIAEIACADCDIHETPDLLNIKLLVDVWGLVRATKDYAMYGKNHCKDYVVALEIELKYSEKSQ